MPRLTITEAARVLGMTATEFTDWIATSVKPTLQQWSNWRKDDAALPEALIRLYLTQQIAATGAGEKPKEFRKAARG